MKSRDVYTYICEHSKKGAPILFLHYLGGDGTIWGNVIPYFSEQYRVITMDLRGHGQSDQPKNGYDMDTMAEDARKVLDEINIDQVHIVGSSLGCYVGTRLASLYPKRVTSLVNSEGAMQNTSGTDGLFAEPKEQFLQKYFSQPEMTFSSRDEYVRFMKKNWVPWNKARQVSVEQATLRKTSDGRLFSPPSSETLRQIASNLFDIQLEKWYETVECPVLFLPADKEGDLQKKLRFISRLERKLPNSRIEVIPNSTHAMMFDNEKEMSKAIINFYRDIT